jgi:hypothetical protein
MNTHTHMCVCGGGGGIFTRKFGILMFGAPTTCLHVLLFTNCHALRYVSSITY